MSGFSYFGTGERFKGSKENSPGEHQNFERRHGKIMQFELGRCLK